MTMDVLEFMAAPFAASLIIAGLHAYMGLHVVERGVIFVDLALAQIAALGASLAVLFGMDVHGSAAWWVSLGACFVGAAIFSSTRMKREKVPQEAIIGIVYAVSAAAAILVLDHAPQGAEHIKDILIGSILVVEWSTVWKTLALYGALGIFHYALREKFLLVTLDPEVARGRGMRLWLWDLLFYISFGLMVTWSVSIAGVLLVFSYLIVPSVAAMLFADRLGPRLAIGWAVGFTVSVLGCVFSYKLDMPTGAAIVCTFGAVLVLLALAKKMFVRA